MDRTSGTGFVTVGGKRQFVDKNLGLGIAGAQVGATFLNGAQESILAVVEAALLTPTDADNTQFLAALRLLTGGLTSYAGNPNGNVAGVAAASGLAPSLCFDVTDQIVYVCITTGTSATAVWRPIEHGISNYQVYSAHGAYSWTCPPGQFLTPFLAWSGGGGAGGAYNNGFSSGGSGGGLSAGAAATVPGTVYPINVGQGGAGGNGTPTNGTAGGASNFAAFCAVTGGGGGFAANSAAQSTLGAAGSGSGGLLNLTGTTGSGGLSGLGGGSGGHAPMGGGGAAAASFGGTGGVGGGPGGGGGGTGAGTGLGYAGGGGADGLVIIGKLQ